MMVGDLFLIVQFNDGVQYHLQKWIQLCEYQPDIYHPHIGGGWQFCHHTKNCYVNLNEKSLIIPDEKSGGDQQDGQVYSHCSLEVERLEEGGGKTHQEQQE